jgi:putative spermidine/putrescine transport system substrate-binding protein
MRFVGLCVSFLGTQFAPQFEQHRKTIAYIRVLTMKRRHFLAAAITTPSLSSSILHAATSGKKPLRVSAFGGFFQDEFESKICQKFTRETGIPVVTISQGQGDDWLFPLVRSVRGGLDPMDLTFLDEIGLTKIARMGNIVQPLQMQEIPAAARLNERYLFTSSDNTLGVGVMEWYQNIVINPEAVTRPPKSWREIFEDDFYRKKIGLIGLYDGGMIEVVAKTYFDGNDTLKSRAGIRAVVEKIAELKDQVGFWWTAESQMEQALRSQNVVAGSFFHDIAMLLAAEHFPIASVFPEEGSFTGINKLCIPYNSTRTVDAHRFIDFCSRADNQAVFARAMKLAPVLPNEEVGLSPSEFELVSTKIPPVQPAAAVMVEEADYLQRLWQRMITR